MSIKTVKDECFYRTKPERFQIDEDCRKYLSEIKWSEGFICLKYGHTKYKIRKNLSITCNICSDTVSPTADTLFHKVKLSLRKAFLFVFQMSTTTKSLSASQMAVRYRMHENTARMFMHKVREAMKSSGKNPMDGVVHIDEFVVGGKENEKPGRSYDSKKKEAICAVQLTEDGKVKRFYAQKVEIFLRKIFIKHVDKNAK